MKEKIRAYLPFLLTGFVAILWHATLKVSVGDDMIYFKTLMDGRSIWQILAHRYQTWSSRLALEFFLIPMVHHTFLWRILDVLVFTTIPVLLCRLLEAQGKFRWWVSAFVLLYPFSDMVSAGWISTTMNYLWPLWCILFLGVLLKKILRHEQIKWYEAAGGTLACLYASSQEQVAVILLLLFVMALFIMWRKKNYKLPLLYLWLGIDLATLISILLCPGNAIRKMQEIEGRMPEFAAFSFGEKLYLGLSNVERIFIGNVDNIFLVVTVTLTILVYWKTRNTWKTLFAGIPVWILLGQSVIRTSHPYFEKIFVIPEQTVQWNWKQAETWLPILFLLACIAGILYALYELMKEDRRQYLCMVLLLGCGLASGVVMGFSPTIYASANRPYIYLYFILLYTALSQMYAMAKRKDTLAGNVDALSVAEQQSKTWSTAEKLAFCITGMFALVNIADVWWMCYMMGRLM